MSKFKIKMKLTGFELEIEGSRDDIPNIQQALAQQINGILQPGAGLIEEASLSDTHSSSKDPNEIDITPAAKSSRKRATQQKSPKQTSRLDNAEQVDWPRDVSGYGSPSQAWSTAEKTLWVLYVAQEAIGKKELTTVQIRDTFNTHYRAAKVIQISNIGRDLNSLKIRNPALVGLDTTRAPNGWFLTQAGTAAVQARIAELNLPQN